MRRAALCCAAGVVPASARRLEKQAVATGRGDRRASAMVKGRLVRLLRLAWHGHHAAGARLRGGEAPDDAGGATPPLPPPTGVQLTRGVGGVRMEPFADLPARMPTAGATLALATCAGAAARPCFSSLGHRLRPAEGALALALPPDGRAQAGGVHESMRLRRVRRPRTESSRRVAERRQTLAVERRPKRGQRDARAVSDECGLISNINSMVFVSAVCLRAAMGTAS